MYVAMTQQRRLSYVNKSRGLPQTSHISQVKMGAATKTLNNAFVFEGCFLRVVGDDEELVKRGRLLLGWPGWR